MKTVLVFNKIFNFFKIFRIGIHNNKRNWDHYLKIKPLLMKYTVEKEKFQIYRWTIFVVKVPVNGE